MALVINTNMSSENAVRLLDQTSRSQRVSMERLTSGLRINHTADDAAGKAVITKMDSQVRGTDMAIRNANDGISLAQTMDGALEEAVNMMQRMRELAIQMANETYTSAQRADAQKEVSQLQIEISRIAVTTKFNGRSLLDSTSKMSFHVGWEQSKVNQIYLSKVDLNTSARQYGSVKVVTQANALSALSLLDKDISAINLARAKLGAVQNRFEHTISNLQNVNENIKAARSQIQDTDFARESANLARTQVLQQAGMAMLSQANQNSQQVLSLLR